MNATESERHAKLSNDVDEAITEVLTATYAHDNFPGPGTEAEMERAKAKLKKAQALLRVCEDR